MCHRKEYTNTSQQISWKKMKTVFSTFTIPYFLAQLKKRMKNVLQKLPVRNSVSIIVLRKIFDLKFSFRRVLWRCRIRINCNYVWFQDSSILLNFGSTGHCSELLRFRAGIDAGIYKITVYGHRYFKYFFKKLWFHALKKRKSSYFDFIQHSTIVIVLKRFCYIKKINIFHATEKENCFKNWTMTIWADFYA